MGCPGVLTVAQWVKNPSSIHEDVGLIPGLVQWVKGSQVADTAWIWHCYGYGVGWRPPLAWVPSYRTGVALKDKKKRKNERKKLGTQSTSFPSHLLGM